MFDFPQNIDESWTLFLDRDGVINERLIDDYVKSIEEFEFIGGAAEAISIFSTIFGRIVVVTNQQGIGKGLMSIGELHVIHDHMEEEIERLGGRIDAIYFCPHLASENCACRKPNIGMALQAKEQFPSIDFNKSLLIGDSPSDIEFGINAGMHTLLIENGRHLRDLM